jgi:hypothetical protein
MTHATEKINREKAKFSFDGDDSIIEESTGQVVYRETGIGEVDLRNVMRGEVFWFFPGTEEEDPASPFTFDDFVSEIVIPDLETAGLWV